MSKKTIKIWIPVLSILAILIVAFIISKKQNEVVRIGHLGIASHLPLYVAEQNGFFRENKIDAKLIRFSSSSSMIDALLSGNLEVGYELGTDAVLNVLIRDKQAFKIFHFTISKKGASHDALLIKKGARFPIQGSGRLVRVGIFPGPTATAMTKIILRKAYNLEQDKNFQMQQLPPTIQLQALEQGQIDVLFTYEPYVSEIVTRNIGQILISGPVEEHVINPWPGGCGVLSKKLFIQSPKTCDKVADAIYKAFSYIETNRNESLAILEKYLNTPADVAKNIMFTSHWKSSSLRDYMTTNMDPLIKLNDYVRFLVENIIINESVDISDYLYNEKNKQ
jgi:NitT/TauT family transport system substrate-binding protein